MQNTTTAIKHCNFKCSKPTRIYFNPFFLICLSFLKGNEDSLVICRDRKRCEFPFFFIPSIMRPFVAFVGAWTLDERRDCLVNRKSANRATIGKNVFKDRKKRGKPRNSHDCDPLCGASDARKDNLAAKQAIEAYFSRMAKDLYGIARNSNDSSCIRQVFSNTYQSISFFRTSLRFR